MRCEDVHGLPLGDHNVLELSMNQSVNMKIQVEDVENYNFENIDGDSDKVFQFQRRFSLQDHMIKRYNQTEHIDLC